MNWCHILDYHQFDDKVMEFDDKITKLDEKVINSAGFMFAFVELCSCYILANTCISQ